MKNKKLFLILILLLPITLLVGFSTWVIVNDVLLSPQENKSSTFYIELNDQEVEFNGSAQLPSSDNIDLTDSNISYKYREVGTSTLNYTDGAPTDAGEYYIYFESSDNSIEASDVKFTIKRKKVLVNSIDITYAEAYDGTNDYRKWENFYDLIAPKISFTDVSGNTIPSSIAISYYLGSELSNGDSQCYYDDNNLSSNVIGSTYNINLEFYGSNVGNLEYCNAIDYKKNNNSPFYVNDIDAILKYKTVKVESGDYHTIEDALEIGGNITLVGSGSSSFPIFTSFTKLPVYSSSLSYSLNSSSTLWITYDNTQTLKASTGTNYINSVLYVPEGIVLNSEGSINVCGVISQNAHSTTGRGILFNNGTINLTAGNFYSYGFTKGIGVINASATSNVVDIMRFYNYTNSGGITLSLSNAKIFPMNCYSIHNISCTLKVEYTATYKIFYDVSISTVTTSDFITFVGDGGFFDMANGYFLKMVEDTTSSTMINSELISSYSKSNQDITQRDIIKIYGTFSDNIIDITTMGQGIKTGLKYAMPIGFMDITIGNDGNNNIGKGTLKNNSYKFLPGSKLTIDTGASLTINSGVNIVFYDEKYEDTFTSTTQSGYINTISYKANHGAWFNSSRTDIGSQLFVNGTLNSLGNLGGLIQTNSTTGKVKLSSPSGLVVKVSKLEYSSDDSISIAAGGTTTITKDDVVYARAYLYTGTSISNNADFVSAGDYFSKEVKLNNISKYGWTSDKLSIFYETNGGLPSLNPIKDILVTSNGYTIKNEDLPVVSKEHYTFGGWFLDSTFSTLALNEIIYASSTLYAKWIPIEYNITYNFKYFNNGVYSDIDNQTIDNSLNPKTFNGDMNHILVLPKSNNNYVFDAFYLDSSYTTPINSIVGENYLDQKSLTLYGVFYPEGTKTYVINYITNNEDYILEDSKVVSSNLSSYVVPNISTKNNDKNYVKYFVGWYTDENLTIPFEGSSTLKGDTTLYAKWKNKIYVEYYANLSSVANLQLVDSGYYIPSSSYSISFSKPEYFGYSYTGIKNSYTNTVSDISSVVLPDSNSLDTIISVKLETVYTELQKHTVTITNKAWVSGSATVSLYTNTGTEAYQTDTKTLSRNQQTTFDIYNNYRFTISTAGTISTSGGVTKSGDYYYVTGDCALSISGGCFVEGTLISLADGTLKQIEEINEGDLLLVFNHETGKLDKVPASFIIHYDGNYNNHSVINLEFDNGTIIKIVDSHGFFDKTLNRYVYINEENILDYIGHEFYVEDGTTTKLIDYSITEEYTRIFSPLSYYHVNVFANGILTVSNFTEMLTNIFEYDENMKYDEDLMKEDIEKYGLYTYEDFKEHASYELFCTFPSQYLKVSVGKGKGKYEDIIWLIETFINDY